MSVLILKTEDEPLEKNDMSYQEEKNAITEVLGRYAQVLNAADAASIPEFYTEDSLFIPEELNTVIKKDKLAVLGNHFLKASGFRISYTIKDIILDADYAFVEATANTFGRVQSEGVDFNKVSVDLFILKKLNNDWKIYRYIFNNVREVN